MVEKGANPTDDGLQGSRNPCGSEIIGRTDLNVESIRTVCSCWFWGSGCQEHSLQISRLCQGAYLDFVIHASSQKK